MAIKENPDPCYLNNYVICCYNQTKYDNAIKYYLTAIEKNHKASYIYNLFLCYYAQKNIMKQKNIC